MEFLKDTNATVVQLATIAAPVAMAALAVRQAQVEVRLKTEERKLAKSTPIPGGTVTEKDGKLHYTPSNGKA